LKPWQVSKALKLWLIRFNPRYLQPLETPRNLLYVSYLLNWQGVKADEGQAIWLRQLSYDCFNTSRSKFAFSAAYPTVYVHADSGKRVTVPSTLLLVSILLKDRMPGAMTTIGKCATGTRAPTLHLHNSSQMSKCSITILPSTLL
jgi:hypothetical protein